LYFYIVGHKTNDGGDYLHELEQNMIVTFSNKKLHFKEKSKIGLVVCKFKAQSENIEF
jgi:hypothetical protein